MKKDVLKNYPLISSANILEEEEMTTVLGGGCKEGCEPGGKFKDGDGDKDESDDAE